METLMRAVQVSEFGSCDKASVAEVAVPVAGPGQVVIDVQAVPLNFVDLLVISGKYQVLPPLPFTPGQGPAGIVVTLGEGVTHVALGDRVLAMAESGGYAQYCVVDAKSCYGLPGSMSFPEAASASLVYETSWFALRERARLAQGETVLVLGASGGVGLAAVHLAKAMGARVLGAIANTDKAQLVRDAGADAIIDLSAPDLHESLRAQVHAHTGGQGADIVLDMLGGDFFDAAVRALAWCGRLVVIGFAAGRIPALKMNYVLLKNIEVSGLQGSDYRKRRPERAVDCYREVFGLFESGRLKAPVFETMPLGDFRAGLHKIEQRAATGRIVLLPQVWRGEHHAISL
jgi:NADPH2:quinone reductase